MQIPAEQQTIDEALAWNGAIVESVLSHRASILGAYHAGISPPGPRFFGMSHDEIEAHFVAEQEEVDALAVVSIVAAAEAKIRQDYLGRVHRNGRDTLSQAYVAFHRKLSFRAKQRPPFDEQGILDVLKDSGVVDGHLVTLFRDVVQERHWFAHGRYWTLKLGRQKYSPLDAHVVSKNLIGALPIQGS